MSGGQVVSVRGGIDVRTDDLRAAALIMSDLAATLREQTGELRAKATSLGPLMYDSALQQDLESGGLRRARDAADESVRLSQSLRDTADRYDDGESWIERLIGNSVALAKDATKASVLAVSGGRVDTPWGWDPRGLEPVSWLADRTGLDATLAEWAAILDWRGDPVVAGTGVDTSAAGTAPPRSMADLLENADRLTSDGASDIGVQFLEYDDGRPRQVIVTLPGTTRLVPGSDTPTDISAGPLALQNLPTSYLAGVTQALELAGVTVADSILLVGYSLGGIIAAQLAQQLAGSRRYNVTNVVTAGSPITAIDIPNDVQVVALENEADFVPYLDPGPNEDSGNVVTVTVDTGATVVDAHELGTGYIPAADAVEASGAPQVQHALEDLQPYLDADRTTTRTYSITRP